MNSQIIVTGTIGYDYIMDFPGIFADRIMPDKVHKISLSFLVESLTKQFGGTATNIGYSLKMLGVDPVILSTAGNDFEPYKTFLNTHQISTEHIKIIPNEVTGSYFVVTDKDDNQIGAFYTGASKYAKELSIKSTVDSPAWAGGNDMKKDTFVVIAPTDPAAMNKYVLECQELGIAYLYDPAFQIGSFTKEDLLSAISHAAILIGNDYEIELICQKLEKKTSELLDLAPIVITTLGSQGVKIESKTESLQSQTVVIQAAKPKEVLDPTGAGDAFRSGFLAGFLRGLDLETCGQMGTTAAVYTIEKYGTTTHQFTLPEFGQRLKQNYPTSAFTP